MNDDQTTPKTDSTQAPTNDTWQEIGQQFQALGSNLAAAFRAAWQSPETQHTVGEMKKGVESMLSEVGKAVNDAANSPDGQKVRSEVNRAAESARQATEKAVGDAQPHVVSALQQLNAELQKMIGQWSQPKDGHP